MSDALDGGRPRVSGDLEDTARRASFWLIDFGLAVDSSTWPAAWPHADVAGDCRYWPPSSFLMSFYGPEEMAARQDLCNQYKTKLDIVGLGLTALEILCATALASSYAWGPDGLRGSWRRLLTSWQRYRDEVTRWHTMIFHVFSAGGDISPLYQQLGQEHVVDKVTAHVAKVRSLLRACVQRTEDAGIQRLLEVLADMIDERSSLGLHEAVDALGGPDMSQAQPQPARPPVLAPLASYVPPQTSMPATPPRASPARLLAAPAAVRPVAAAAPGEGEADAGAPSPQLSWRPPHTAAVIPARTGKAHPQDVTVQVGKSAKGYTRPARVQLAGA